MNSPPKKLPAVVTLVVCAVSVLTGAGLPHPYEIAQPADAPQRLLAIVEIPAGSDIKYEVHASGHVLVDRFLQTPVAYPANYGSLPSVRAADGDPVDVLVITRTPVAPGVLIHVRPVGALRMFDDGEADHKVVAVPTNRVDPRYAAIRDIMDLSEAERRAIETFFQIYKILPSGSDEVTTDGFMNADEVRALLQALLDADGQATP
jgi:inorganic pyrophosphatase